MGVTNKQDGMKSIKRIARRLQKLDIPVKISNVYVKNIVGVGYIKKNLSLSAIAETVRGIKFNPELFPGMSLALEKPAMTFVIFTNGKILIPKCKSEADLASGYMTLYEFLTKFRARKMTRSVTKEIVPFTPARTI